MPLFSSLAQRVSRSPLAVPVSPVMLVTLTVAFLFCSANTTFWSIAAGIFQGHAVSFAGYILAVFLLTVGAFSLFGFPWVVKPFLAFIVILSAVTSYYMDRLGVIIDRDMIQNVMVTTMAESRHLITFSFVAHVLAFGVVPACALLAVRIKPQRPLRAVAVPVLTAVLSVSLAAGLLMADFKSYASILHERKDLMSSFQPGAPLVGAVRYAKMMSQTASVTVASIGADARKGPAYQAGDKPVLTLVVIGETARAQNFSLNGYGTDTNPRLAQLPVVNFSDVSSCGTATAVSLPCMFSGFGRDSYSYEKGIGTENVLDVLSHAGLAVEWWDNNTGDKELAARITSRSFTQAQDPVFCGQGECIDGIFMQALRDYAGTITRDTVLVLHQIGSHGPTYYLRYPPEFERFTPACHTAEFNTCTPGEITNAYDNTIAYTDEILAETIAVLNAEDGLATAMLYVSDHGESLGEAGLYLHGSPYFMAPAFQTKVPMILWMSDGFKDKFSLDAACLAQKQDDTLSHDVLFHSLLGMLDITTGEHDSALDIFATCKGTRQYAGH